MKTKTKQLLTVMKVLTWIVFLGLCIKTGAILFSYLMSIFYNSVAASNLYLGLDLSELKSFNITQYSILACLIIALSALKTFLFYKVIKIFMTINFENPFSEVTGFLIRKISSIALIIGLLASVGEHYTDWVIDKGINLPNVMSFIYGGSEFIFFAGILYIISLVFKTGIKYQEELDETV